MAILRITCIIKSQPNGGHEHITDAGNSAERWNFTVPQVVQRIESNIDAFYVQDDRTGKRATVGVVRETGKRPFIRTYADGYFNDNLLSLTFCPWKAAA